MLLEFAIENYKSFADEAVFSMEPAPKQKGLDYSIHSVKVGRATHRALSSAVIYGPNASGKTAIIGALDTLRAIVLRGNIRDAQGLPGLNKAASELSLIPNSALEEPRPVCFRIRFVEGELFEYSLRCDLGAFGDDAHPREVAWEALSVNGRTVFERGPDHVSIDPKPLNGSLARAFEGNEKAVVELAANLAPTDLFLNGVFKTFVSPAVAERVLGWFERKLIVVYRADMVRAMHRPAQVAEGTPYVEHMVNEAARAFGISSNALGYVVPEGETEPKLVSLFAGGQGAKVRALPAEDYESFGTVRFINMFPLVADAIMTGATLVVDEFDASIHPMALMSILSVFHNDELNRKGAQLIFDTHNPVFLNGNVLRRDEIKFVERDAQTGHSQHYALSDFGTSGAAGVRQGQDYMKNYFLDRYGAINDIDFSPVFEEMIESDEEGNE